MISNEILGACPCCGFGQRSVLHPQVADNTFSAVEGNWSLWRCLGCGCAYLDPRPTRESISLAYRNYYTHSPIEKTRYEDLSPLRKVRRRLANGYARWRYGANLSPRSSWGVLLALLMPPVRWVVDLEYRHLPGAAGSLLDVGCGSGAFLAQASECGWDAYGIDPDPQAVAAGIRQRVNVRQGDLDLFAGEGEKFDVITMSHVIEHFHDPVAAVSSCFRLLKPGGVLWVATPNIDSFGFGRFGEFWRGLEAPRHLVLFNEKSLEKVLFGAGFSSWRRAPIPSAHGFIAQASHAIEKGCLPNDPSIVLSRTQRFMSILTSWVECLYPSRREFLCVAAIKGE